MIPTKPKIFLTWSDQLSQRLDPLYHFGDVFEFLAKSQYEVVQLSNVITFIKSGFAAGKTDQATEEGGVIQIRPTNMDEFGILKFDKNVVLPREAISKRSKDLVQRKEVLFNNTNSQELVGKTAYFDLDGEYFCSNHITRIRADEERLLPKFLWQLLNSYQARGIFYNLCVNWNNQSGVNIELLKTLKIPLPSIEKQKEIISTLEKAYAEKWKKEQEIKAILASIDGYVLTELGIDIAGELERERESR